MSLRDKLLSLLTGEQKANPGAPTPVISVREESPAERDAAPAPVNSDGEACPKCGGRLVEVAANIKRCQQCGHQERFEQKRTVVPPVIVKPRAAAPNACPKCGSDLMTTVGSAFRCAQCGNQVEEPHATGLSRKDLETYDGPGPHAQMSGGASFFRASAWMRFGR